MWRSGYDARLRRLRERDLEGLAELYDAHAATAYRFACALLADADLAAEAVEAGFLTLWRERPTSSSEAAAVLAAVDRACVERDRAGAPLARLPDAQRRALALTLSGLTVEQTAALVGTSRDAVRRDLTHGLRAIRGSLAAIR